MEPILRSLDVVLVLQIAVLVLLAVPVNIVIQVGDHAVFVGDHLLILKDHLVVLEVRHIGFFGQLE